MHPLMHIAIKAARRAGQVILKGFDQRDRLQIERKAANDFVSQIDREAEAEIIDTIHQAYPGHGILAEESGAQTRQEDVTWIIDPLDGTRNFIQGLPHFSVSIAVRYENCLQHGVVFDPIRDELFYASRGDGARLNNQRLRVSTQTEWVDAMLATGFPFRNFDRLDAYLVLLNKIIPEVRALRRTGSAALDLAYVASGRMDGFWEMDLKPWDIAAGILLVQEAGGRVADFDGGHTYLTDGDLVASNKKLFKVLLQHVHRLRRTAPTYSDASNL